MNSGSRVFVPLMFTAAVLAIAKQWPQVLWSYMYYHTHGNVDVIFTSANGQTAPNGTLPPPATIPWAPGRRGGPQ